MAGGFGNVRNSMYISSESPRSAFTIPNPELEAIPVPVIDRKDVTERQAIAGALKALPPMPEIKFMAAGPSIQQQEQYERNNALRAAYGSDRARLERDARIARIKNKRLSAALSKRDEIAAKSMKRRGAAQQRFAQQRIKDLARDARLGPHLYRVLK